MANPTDELLAALPEVGLRLVTLGEHRGAALWGAMLAQRGWEPGDTIYDGHGDTPAAALIAALKEAGVDVSDE